MIIDSHEHLLLPIESQVKKLEEAGVDKAILFCTTPHPEKCKTLTELKNEMSVLNNILTKSNTLEENIKRIKNSIEDLKKALKMYPNKFYGFGAVPLGMSLDNTINWIKNYIISNELKGVGEFTPSSDKEIEALETVFKALTNYPKLPIWIHTFHPVSLNGLRILMEFTRKYPKVPVIFGHMGGSNWMELINFAKSVPNAYIDLSAVFSTLATHIAITELPDKCLYSSDLPYGEPYLSKQFIEYISPSKEVTNKILGGNILKLIN